MTEPIIVQECFNISPAAIWQAITEKEQMKQWYFDIPDFDPRINSSFNFYEHGNDKKFHHQCVIKEIMPTKLLQHTWTYPDKSKGASLVTWEIIPIGHFTLVQLTHDGVESFSDGGSDFLRENYVAGWNEIIGKSLRSYLYNNKLKS